MNAWVLSLIICSAIPAPDGSYCSVSALKVGLSRESCRAALGPPNHRSGAVRLECTEDPDLTARLRGVETGALR
jgi:hypothetical protein